MRNSQVIAQQQRRRKRPASLRTNTTVKTVSVSMLSSFCVTPVYIVQNSLPLLCFYVLLIFQIGVARAVRTRQSFKKQCSHVEVILNELDSYATTIAKACNACGVRSPARSPNYYLVRSNGCRVTNKPFPDGTPWSIGRYLKQCSSVRTQLKFGLVMDEVSGVQ